MAWNRWRTCSVLLLLLLVTRGRAQQREFFFSAAPSDMKVDGGGRVFLAAGNQLLRLDSTLALQENVTLASSVLRVALSSDERRVVVCLSDMSCAVYNASDFGAGELLRRTGASVSSDVVALFTARENSFYVGSVVGGATASMNLGQYGFVESFARSTNYRIERTNFMRTFFGGFVNGTNAYYFMTDGRPSDVRGLRVLRACDISTCSSPCNFDGLYELRIDCGGGSFPQNSVICGLSVLDSFADSSDTTVVLARCNTGTSARNRVCSFQLADIDDNMDRKYTQCAGRIGDIQLAWDSAVNRRCSSEFQTRGVCDFSPPLGDVEAGRSQSDAGLPVAGSVQLEFGDTEITASAAITIDFTSIIYVGYTNGSRNFVGAFYITTTSPSQPFPGPANSFYTRSVSSPVRQLQWESGVDYIYVATESSVLQIPLEECANFTDCESCISYSNPLCGWCTVEHKCSRRSQCQNAMEPVRWVQNSSQCISTTITPNQFVLDDPEILSVTVTPGLPPLLTNESYQCQFTDREGLRVITVDAEEVTPNTVYQCNITGRRIPTFTGVQLVTDFSFVSSRAGIPFATNMGALTVTRCESAASCSQCLQTDNACGWCIYNKMCSGIPDRCTNETNWLQLNGTNTTYLDVCPLLEPSSSTPSGDYVQPVGVARDIELQTRNLPAPIGGFRYVCSLRGTVTLPAVYNNESSLTCRVNENQISSSSSTGSENTTISIVWIIESLRRQHPIDLRIPVNMVLYNCRSLADGCSSCLGANRGTGFDCGWCSGSSDDMCRVSENCHSPAQFATTPLGCPNATITGVLPASGPPEGGTTVNITGTDLGVTYDDIVNNVMISSSPCITQEDGYIPGTQIVCETTTFTSGPGPKDLIVTVQRGTGSPLVVRGMFTVVAPTMTGVEPSLGPMSGGTSITVRGTGLNISNVDDTRVTLDGEDGPECMIQMQGISGTEIRCDSTAFPYNSSLLPSTGSVVVHIGNADVTGAGVEFTFRQDPTFLSVTPMMTIAAGGISLNFTGTELNSVQRPTLVVYDPSASPQRTVCRSESPTLLVCTAPALSSGDPGSINYTIIMDNAPGPSSVDLPLTLVPNPRINTSDYTVSAGSPITITYNGVVDLTSFDRSEIQVLVGGVPCNIINVDSGTIVCTPPSQAPGGGSEVTVMVMIGTNFNFTVGTLRYTTTPLNLQLIIPVIAGPVALVLLLSMLVICIIICVTRSSARAKDKRLTTLLSQMELWELEMADECKRAFTELQTDLADLVHVSADKNLPYRDFRTFAMRFLFPSAGDDHPVLLPLDISEKRDHEAAVQHLEGFKKLVLDKKFLTVFVRTLEAQQGSFNLQDKCNVASLLMVAFQNDLDYATDILQTLLSELMRKTVAKSHPKLLLRRTESVAEKMLANWLSFLLFPHVLEHVGEPLFILYRAVKSQLEKGPVDVLTGEARHSLSEEKLLRQHLDVKSVEGVIETESGEEISIKLLDTDSVTQAKEKVLDALYRNTPVSKRPQLTSVDLELRRANAGVVLRDQDQTNVKEGEWTRVNTLGHYKLDEMSQAHIDNPKAPIPRFRIVPRPQRPMSEMSFDTLGTIIANVNASRSSILSSEAPRVYHLVKPELGEAEDGGPRQGAKIMSEVFLTRLLSTKRILQPYVDALFHAIFAIPRGRPLPKAIKCLFDFLDLQAAELGIQDHEILHTWKTNSLPLRFWVNLIKNPDFVFDINKSATVDACLTIIAQAYIDACSTAELRYTKDTPSARLLYVNEVKNYKNDVRQYYDSIQSLPKLAPSEMQEYLRETAQTRQLYFVTESALYELFKYASRYGEEISEALNDEGLSVLASSFEELQKSLKV